MGRRCFKDGLSETSTCGRSRPLIGQDVSVGRCRRIKCALLACLGAVCTLLSSLAFISAFLSGQTIELSGGEKDFIFWIHGDSWPYLVAGLALLGAGITSSVLAGRYLGSRS